ncbi:MAG: hypothetical protein AAGJ83_07965 [Planctomycetota bacterium]
MIATVLLAFFCRSGEAVDRIRRLEPGMPIQLSTKSVPGMHVVLLAQPKLNSGNTEAVSDAVSDAATACSLAIVAECVQRENKLFELTDVAVGYCANAADVPVTISSATASQHGVQLGFIARQVLKVNEEGLEKLSVVGRSDQAFAFDAPSILFRRGKHRRYLTRHLVTIDPVDGNGRLFSWLMVPADKSVRADGSLVLINHPVRCTRWGTRETRRIHVDGEEFSFLGVPSDLAFALEDLPPGDDVPWDRATAKLACKAAFTSPLLDELANRLREAHVVVGSKR